MQATVPTGGCMEVEARVLYVLRGLAYGVPEGYAVLSIWVEGILLFGGSHDQR